MNNSVLLLQQGITDVKVEDMAGGHIVHLVSVRGF